MKVAIMQPYFLPYLGYWQLIQAADVFVLYDNIKYTKKGWINRNRIDPDVYITLPLKRGSDFLEIREREVAASWPRDRDKLLRRLADFYRGARNYDQAMLLARQILLCNLTNLYGFLDNAIRAVCKHLDLKTPIRASSSVPADHSLPGAERVKAVCRALGGAIYINPIGGQALYDREDFARDGLELRFLRARAVVYDRGRREFAPRLSILDLLMHNPREQARAMLEEYDLL